MRTAVVLPLLLTVAACSGGGSSDKPVTKSSVTVSAALTSGSLAVTFTPKAGFHLYSADLPAGGVDGVGLATGVTVSGGLTATAKPSASEPVKTITVEGVNGEIPVYPEGPVTLTLPVTGTKGTATVQYAACSDQICLPPVQALTLPVG